jgi:hypothetical protein
MQLGQEPLIALPLVLPMGWKNSPLTFCMAMETIADLANTALQQKQIASLHHLYLCVSQGDYLIAMLNENPTTNPSIAPDPSIPAQLNPLTKINVYVNDFIALAQGDKQRLWCVCSTLLHSIDSLFQPNDEHDTQYRAETVSN